MASIFYKNSFLYDLMLKFVHGNHLKKRYSLISGLIGKKGKVFELGCGTSMIYPYLAKSVEYEGWDLNKKFIDDSMKKGLNVKLKSVFEYKSYPKADVVLIIDVLHHIFPRHEELIKKAKKSAKKVIIVEPFNSSDNFLDRIKTSKKSFFFPIVKLFNKLIGDNDGINRPDVLFDWNYDKKSLESFFKKIGAKKTMPLGSDLIAII